MDIQQRTERQPIIPTRAEIPDLDFVIARRLPLAPQQQALLRSHALLVDVRDGEAENEGPDQPEDNLAVAIHDVFRPDVGHLDAPRLYEVEREIGVFEALDAEFGFGGVAAEGFVGETFEEVDEDDLGEALVRRTLRIGWPVAYSIAEIVDQILDFHIPSCDLGVQPAHASVSF